MTADLSPSKKPLEPEVLEWCLQKMKHIPITTLCEREPYDNTHFTYGGCELFLAAAVLAQMLLSHSLVGPLVLQEAPTVAPQRHGF